MDDYLLWAKRFRMRFSAWLIGFTVFSGLLLGSLQSSRAAELATASIALKTSGMLLPRDNQGHTNVLLLGVGDANHTAAHLTDSIIVASVDPADASIVLLSIPRDLYVEDAEGIPPGRINTLYAIYRNAKVKEEGMTDTDASLFAMRKTADDIGKRLGVQIHGVLKVDFTGFSEIVDAVGGVDIDVKQSIADYHYPVSKGVIGTFHMESGLQHMDGPTALQYARSRQSTSDFSRSERQQQILTALGGKMRTLHFIEDVSILRSIERTLVTHFETTFQKSELLALGATAALVPRERILRMQLLDFIRTPALGSFSGAVLLPVSDTGAIADWTKIRSFVQTLFSFPDLYFWKPSVVF